MRFTNAFTVLAASVFFASANCASVHEDLAIALSRLQGLHAEVHARAEPAVITTDITTIVKDGTGLAKDIATLIKDIQASPAEATKPDAATILVDATKVANDITTLINDIATLAKDAKN